MSAAPIPLSDGRFTVPGNRWDLLNGHAATDSTVGVVIPFYDQQRELDLTLAALERQTYPAHLLRVVVADDGSACGPVLPSSPLDIAVVRQDDLGFRAAAARNLGAAATDADVLCFLDADTVPEPGYVRAITRLPAQLPDVLAVGMRRYAHLTALPSEVPPQPLADAVWLRDGYAASDDLLHVDHQSYRFVISSVMCCSATLFDDLGGFDESFVGYGGEDWEFAHRAYAGGAVLHHAADAVAWHDGPDWAGRDVPDRAAVKNAEALVLARVITDPAARRPGLRYALPGVAVEIDATGHSAASLVRTISGFLGEDVGVWVRGDHAARLLAEIGADDDRLHAGPIPADVERRCRFVVTTTGRAVLSRAGVAALLAHCSAESVGAVTATAPGAAVRCRSTWALNRVRRWTTGAVRFAEPADADRVGSAVPVSAESIDLRCGADEPDLSW